MKISGISGYTYRLALHQPIFARGAPLAERRGLLLAVEADGQCGWGEAAPFPGIGFESLKGVCARAQQCAHGLVGMRVEEALKRCDTLRSPALHFSLCTALHRLSALAPARPVNRVPLCALLDGEDAALDAQAANAASAGYRAVKLKVGRLSVDRDLARTQRVYKILGPACRLRLDANRGWNYEQARAFCQAVGALPIDFIEEPTDDPAAFNSLRDETGVAIAVDETLEAWGQAICSGNDTPSLKQAIEQASFLVWKPTLCLPPRLLKLHTVAPIVLSGCYESGIGTAAIIAHGAMTASRQAVGVDTYRRFAADVLTQPLSLKGPHVDMEAVTAARDTVNPDLLEGLWHV